MGRLRLDERRHQRDTPHLPRPHHTADPHFTPLPTLPPPSNSRVPPDRADIRPPAPLARDQPPSAQMVRSEEHDEPGAAGERYALRAVLWRGERRARVLGACG